MVKADDVAAHILLCCGPMTAVRLHRLIYYTQAWHTVWEGPALFADRIEAWSFGPMLPSLYEAHRGVHVLHAWPFGNPTVLQPDELGTIDAVLDGYREIDNPDLGDLVRREGPWLGARRRSGLGSMERGSEPISVEELRLFYTMVRDSGVAVSPNDAIQ